MLSNNDRNRVLLYLTDTMADWEYGHAIAEINRWAGDGGAVELHTVAATTEPVTTKGGLQVAPQLTLDDVDEATVALLILPGADTWFEGHDNVLDLASRLLAAGAGVAAICGATFGLARAGLLDDRAHTSNDPAFLAASGYAGGDRYQAQPAVRDEGVITASAIWPVPFAAAIFDQLGLRTPAWREAWQLLYTTGRPEHFFQLMEAEGA